LLATITVLSIIIATITVIISIKQAIIVITRIFAITEVTVVAIE